MGIQIYTKQRIWLMNYSQDPTYFLLGSLRMIPPAFIAALKDWTCKTEKPEREMWSQWLPQWSKVTVTLFLVPAVLTESERYVQGIALYTILVMPACWQRCASTSPTAWQAATQFVEASSFFTAHSLVEQESTGIGEQLENTWAVTWCWLRENINLKQ